MKFNGIQDFIIKLEHCYDNAEKLRIINEELTKIKSNLENDFNTGYNRHKIRAGLLKLIYIDYSFSLPDAPNTILMVCRSLLMSYGLKILNLPNQKNKIIGFFALSTITQKNEDSTNSLTLLETNSLLSNLNDDKPEYLKSLCLNYLANPMPFNEITSELLIPRLIQIVEDITLPTTIRSKVFYVAIKYLSSFTEKKENNNIPMSAAFFDYTLRFAKLACKYIRECTVMWPSPEDNNTQQNSENSSIRNSSPNENETRTSINVVSSIKKLNDKLIPSKIVYTEDEQNQLDISQYPEDSVDEFGFYTNNLQPVGVKLRNPNGTQKAEANEGDSFFYNEMYETKQERYQIPFRAKNILTNSSNIALVKNGIETIQNTNQSNDVSANGGFLDETLEVSLGKIIQEYKDYNLIPNTNLERERRIDSIKIQSSRRRIKWAMVRASTVYLKRFMNELFYSEKNYMYNKNISSNKYDDIIKNSFKSKITYSQLTKENKENLKNIVKEISASCAGFLHTFHRLNIWPPNSPVYHHIVDPFMQFNLFELMQHYVLIQFYSQASRHLIRSSLASIFATRKFDYYERDSEGAVSADKNYANIRATLLIYAVSFVIRSPFLWSIEILDDCILRLLNLLGKSKGQRSNYLGAKYIFGLLNNITEESEFLYDYITNNFQSSPNTTTYKILVSEVDKESERNKTIKEIPVDKLKFGLYVKVLAENSNSPSTIRSPGEEQYESNSINRSGTEVFELKKYNIGNKIATHLQELITPSSIENYDCTTMYLALKSFLKLAEFNELPLDITVVDSFFVLKCLVSCNFEKCATEIIDLFLSTIKNSITQLPQESSKIEVEKKFSNRLSRYTYYITELANISGTLFSNYEIEKAISIFNTTLKTEFKACFENEITTHDKKNKKQLYFVDVIIELIKNIEEKINKSKTLGISLACYRIMIEELDSISVIFKRVLDHININPINDTTYENHIKQMIKKCSIMFNLFFSIQSSLKTTILSAEISNDYFNKYGISLISSENYHNKEETKDKEEESQQFEEENNANIKLDKITGLIKSFDFTQLPEYNLINYDTIRKPIDLTQEYLRFDKLSTFSRILWMILYINIFLIQYHETYSTQCDTYQNLISFLILLSKKEFSYNYLNEGEIESYIFLLNNYNNSDKLSLLKIFAPIPPKKQFINPTHEGEIKQEKEITQNISN